MPFWKCYSNTEETQYATNGLRLHNMIIQLNKSKDVQSAWHIKYQFFKFYVQGASWLGSVAWMTWHESRTPWCQQRFIWNENKLPLGSSSAFPLRSILVWARVYFLSCVHVRVIEVMPENINAVSDWVNSLHNRTQAFVSLCFKIQSSLRNVLSEIPSHAAERCALVSKVKTNLDAEIPSSLALLTLCLSPYKWP